MSYRTGRFGGSQNVTKDEDGNNKKAKNNRERTYLQIRADVMNKKKKGVKNFTNASTHERERQTDGEKLRL